MVEKFVKYEIKNDSNSTIKYFNLIEESFDTGDFDKLFNLFDILLNLNLSNQEIAYVYYKKGEALLYVDKPDQASNAFYASIKHINDKDQTWESLLIKPSCLHYLFKGCSDPTKANKLSKKSLYYFDKLLDKYPDHKDIHYVYSAIADIKGRLEKYDEALQYYEKAIASQPNKLQLMIYFGSVAFIYAGMKKYRLAEEYYLKAIYLTSESSGKTDIYYGMGLMYYELNSMIKANKAMLSALYHKKNDPLLKNNIEYQQGILWYLGIIAYELEYNDDVIKYLYELLDVVDDSTDYYTHAHLNLGHVFSKMSNFKNAKKHYKKVIDAKYEDIEAKTVANESLSYIKKNMSLIERMKMILEGQVN